MLNPNDIKTKKQILEFCKSFTDKGLPKLELRYIYNDGENLIATDTRFLLILNIETVKDLFNDCTFIDINNQMIFKNNDIFEYPNYKHIDFHTPIKTINYDVCDWKKAFLHDIPTVFKNISIDLFVYKNIITKIIKQSEENFTLKLSKDLKGIISYESNFKFNGVLLPGKVIMCPIYY